MPAAPLKRVLLADDSHRSRQVLRLYQEHHPQVVLMDVIMPTMGGMTALARLRQRDSQAQVILLCSSDHLWAVCRLSARCSRVVRRVTLKPAIPVRSCL